MNKNFGCLAAMILIATPVRANEHSWHLLTQTERGMISLLKDLTRHECEFARARALGLPATDEEKATANRQIEVEQREHEQRRAEWLKSHSECNPSDPHKLLPFPCSEDPYFSRSYVRMVSPNDIKSAECFQ